MSSEAITRNDLSAILNEVLPPTPSEYKKLLWSNPSPTSAFNAQTIPLDLSNYDAIEIIIRADTANTYTIAPIITEVGKGGIAFNSTAYNSVRQFTTTTSGITFTGATYYSAYGNWSGSSTNALIPVKIYGIKYERVAPPQLVITSGCEIIKGSTGISTSGTTIYFDNTLDDYDFVLIGASWGVGGVVTGYLYVPVVWWTGTTDVIKVYLNNNPSNDSLTIGNRDNSKATISSSNANVACQVMGIKL